MIKDHWTATEGDPETGPSTEGETTLPETEALEEPEENAKGEDDEEEGAAPRDPRTIPLLGIDPQTLAQGIATFDDLPLNDAARAGVKKNGWSAPTPVQKLCLPFTLRGRDVAGFAQTGTGKTGVFLLSIMNRLLEAGATPGVKVLRAVVLAPTRELAMQIEQDSQLMFEEVGLNSLAVFGGIDYDKQARKLKEGVDVIFATPGRLMDYVRKKLVDLKSVSVFVCDEADRMFDMGFIDDVEFFLERIPETAQKLLFSATTNEQVKELAFEYLETPEYISVTPETLTPEKIEMHAIHVHARHKLKVMLGLLRDHKPQCALIFTNTKLTAEWLHFKLVNNGIDVDLITGDLPQKKRIRLIHRIKDGQIKALIGTDVASRGLHISMVTHVYNFDLPDDPSNYVHRVGRTARAGASGQAYSLVCDDYGQNLAGINTLLGERMSLKSEWYDDGYLQIEDKAGDPFEGRRTRKGRDRYDAEMRERGEGPRGRGGPDGGPRGGRGDGRPRHDRGGGPDHARAGAEGRMDGRGHGGQGGRGGRGRGDQQGQPRDGQRGRPQHQGDGRGPRDGRRDQQHGRGRPNHHDRSQGRHQPTMAADAVTHEVPKTFGGMIKKFFKTLFGKK